MANMAYQPQPNIPNYSLNPLCPTDLGAALQAVQLNPNEQPWHMDSGAHPISLPIQEYPTGRILSRHDSTGDLYPLTGPTKIPTACLVSNITNTWHNRLGHPGHNILSLLFRQFSIPSNKDCLSFCHSCRIANSKHLPLHDSMSVTTP